VTAWLVVVGTQQNGSTTKWQYHKLPIQKGAGMTIRFLVLFDIDGTLLSADRSGYYALEQAVREVLQSPRGLEGIRLDGNTDTNAIHQICARDQKPYPGPEVLAAFKQRYVEVLKREIVGKGHLKPGVLNLLTRLRERADIGLGLVTGNFREGADIKLSAFGIREFFPLGAFGCEHPERSHLIVLAISRAEKQFGVGLAPDRITMIGDTIYDVRACLPSRVRSLAVATGSAPVTELEKERPTLALADLSATDQVLNFLAPPD
jgi:phosphoglycolate phosphatase-like HAD superfamily hydrolase